MIDEASNAEYLRAREAAAEYRRRSYEVGVPDPIDVSKPILVKFQFRSQPLAD